MYLSRVEIDVFNRKNIKNLSHLGAYHSWVEDSFPEEKKEHVRSRKLWRIDKLYNKQYLLILSEVKPNFELLEKYGVKGTAESKDYGKFLENLKYGMKAKFRIVLNPVISKKTDFSKRGKVYPHVTIKHQLEYLEKRAEKNGFILNECNIVNRGTGLLKKDNKYIEFIKVTYEGVLTITDIEKIKHTLKKGIGREKTYGFGLLTIIPII